jgi:hypothetical protein
VSAVQFFLTTDHVRTFYRPSLQPSISLFASPPSPLAPESQTQQETSFDFPLGQLAADSQTQQESPLKIVPVPSVPSDLKRKASTMELRAKKVKISVGFAVDLQD